VYYGDFPVTLQLNYVREHPEHVHLLETFKNDVKSGKLGSFSFIEPRWFTLLEAEENIGAVFLISLERLWLTILLSEHPQKPSRIENGAVSTGEALLKDIYEALVKYVPYASPLGTEC